MDDEPPLQSLRRGPSGRVFQVEAHYHASSQQYVVLWEDILEAFPDASNLLKGSLIVTRARDAALRIIEPRCIKHQPGNVLEIVGGEELAPSSGRGTLNTPHVSGTENAALPQQLTFRNIEQWTAMTTNEDTLLGGSYAPTIYTLTSTTTVPFKPLMVPTESAASSMRDSTQGSEGEFEREDEQGDSLADDKSGSNDEADNQDGQGVRQDSDQSVQDEPTGLTRVLAITPATVNTANKGDAMDNPLSSSLKFPPSTPLLIANAFRSSPPSPREDLAHPSWTFCSNPLLLSPEPDHLDSNTVQPKPELRRLSPSTPDAVSAKMSAAYSHDIFSFSDLVNELEGKNDNNGCSDFSSISNSSTSDVPTSPTSISSTSTVYTSPEQLSSPPQAPAKPKEIDFLKSTYNRIAGRQLVKHSLPHAAIVKYAVPLDTLPIDSLNDELDSSTHRQEDAFLSTYLLPPHPPQDDESALSPHSSSHRQEDAFLSPYLFPPHPPQGPLAESPVAEHTFSQKAQMPHPTSLSLAPNSTRADTSSDAMEATDEPAFENRLPYTGNVDPSVPWSQIGSRLLGYSDVSEVHSFNVLTQAKVWFGYPGDELDKLPLHAGDVIDVVEYLNDDCWRGVNTARNVLGIFPSA